METYSVIGTPVPQVGGEDKVTGRILYSADVALSGTLFGKCLSSPYAHARILAIETSKARQIAGVHAVITGADVQSGGLWGRAVKDVPVRL